MLVGNIILEVEAKTEKSRRKRSGRRVAKSWATVSWTVLCQTMAAAAATRMVMKFPRRNTRKVNVIIIGIMIQNTKKKKGKRRSIKRSQRKSTKRTEIDSLDTESFLKGRIRHILCVWIFKELFWPLEHVNTIFLSDSSIVLRIIVPWVLCTHWRCVKCNRILIADSFEIGYFNSGRQFFIVLFC